MTNTAQIELINVGVFFTRPRKGGESVIPTFSTSAFRLPQKKEWVLREISLSASAGEIIAVLGRNGAGKTTLLRVLEGALLPDRGVIKSAIKPVSMSSLMSGFIGNMSVLANVRTLGHVRGISIRDLAGFSREVIEFAGLLEKSNHAYRSLSTGMKARLGFAFAHIFEPEILLIDEGFSNGDRWFREKSQKALQRYLTSGKTVFITGHSETILRQACSRGIVIENGILIFDGPVSKAFEKYHSIG